MRLFEVEMSYREALTVLGLSDRPSDDEIKAAYRAASRKHHPDAGGSEEDMKRVNAAYEIVKKSPASSSSKFDWQAHKVKHEQLANVIMADMQQKFDPAVFVQYFEKIIGKPFKSVVDQHVHTSSYYGSANINAEFTSEDGNTVIAVKYVITTQGVDINQQYLGFGGMTLSTYVDTSVLHNLRKFKMKQRNYEYTKDGSVFIDPAVLFPVAKLRKMVADGEGDVAPRKAAKRDFILAFDKKLGMKSNGNDFYSMPIGGDFSLLVYRMTFMRMGSWSINGVYQRNRRVSMGPTVTFFENAETLDFMVHEFSKLKGMTDIAQIDAALTEIVVKYKSLQSSS